MPQRSVMCRCPFHADTSPSMSIAPEEGFYYCHGCGAKGDLFTLGSLLGLSAKDAVEAAYGYGAGTFQELLARQGGESSGGRWEPPSVGSPTSRAIDWLRRRGFSVNGDGRVGGVSAEHLPMFAEGESVLAITAWTAVFDGERIGWEPWRYYRAMSKRFKSRYFSTEGFPRGRCLGVGGERFGEHLYLSEGVFDALAILVAQEVGRIPPGPSFFSFGTKVTQDQMVIVKSLLAPRRLVLAYDNDRAGLDVSLALLRAFPEAAALTYPGLDPGEAIQIPESRWGLQDGMAWLQERTADDSKERR